MREDLKLLPSDFTETLGAHHKIAIAVSGGPDSMALCAMVAAWAAGRAVEIYAYTVDHGLRPESGAEAGQVANFLKTYPVHHRILKWEEGGTVTSRLQEAARAARYDLIAQAMKADGVTILLTAHHQDDQAETVLFRLAKGSGLDGLAGMQAQQPFKDIIICRPLLTIAKAELVAYCNAHQIPYVQDPSNDQDRFARIRLRQSMEVLAAEGLTPKRLAVTARRLSRARNALDEMADILFKTCVLSVDTNQIVLKYALLREAPEEIALRALIRAMEILITPGDYPPRLERVENLFYDLMKPEAFRKRTLSGVIFERKDQNGNILLTKEM